MKPVSIFLYGPPPVSTWWFEFEKESSLTVFYGRNGAGKTTLLRALASVGGLSEAELSTSYYGIEIIYELEEDYHRGRRPSIFLHEALFPKMGGADGQDVTFEYLKGEEKFNGYDDVYQRGGEPRDEELIELLSNLSKPLLGVRWIATGCHVFLASAEKEVLKEILKGKESAAKQVLQSELDSPVNGGAQTWENEILKFNTQIDEEIQALSVDEIVSKYCSIIYATTFINSEPSLLADEFVSSDFFSSYSDIFPPNALPPKWAPVTLRKLGTIRPEMVRNDFSVFADPYEEFPNFLEPTDFALNEKTLESLKIKTQERLERETFEVGYEIQGLQNELENMEMVLEDETTDTATLKKTELLQAETRKKEEKEQKKYNKFKAKYGDFYTDDLTELFFLNQKSLEFSDLFLDEVNREEKEVNDLLKTLLIDPPELLLTITPLIELIGEENVNRQLLEWKVRTRKPSTSQFPRLSSTQHQISALSSAQERWARFAIDFVSDTSPLVLIDEPERALHLTAQRHLANGLKKITQERDVQIIVSTHSPEFLKDPSNKLMHVYRDGADHVRSNQMNSIDRENLDSLGLDPIDALQLTNRFILVEGEHDKIALEVLLEDSLEELRAEVLPARGANNIAQVLDSQFLMKFTQAGLVMVLDNTSAELAKEMLEELDTATTQALIEGNQKGISNLLAEWKKKLSDGRDMTQEEKKLAGFLQEAAFKAATDLRLDRITVFGFEKEDIIEYLDCETLVPGQNDWEKLREEYRHHESQKNPWKKWLTDEYNANFDPERIRSAAQKAKSSTVSEFYDLIETIKTVPNRTLS